MPDNAGNFPTLTLKVGDAHLSAEVSQTVKDGENYYSKQSDNFFVGNAFPTCGINFTAQEIMGQTQSNQ